MAVVADEGVIREEGFGDPFVRPEPQDAAALAARDAEVGLLMVVVLQETLVLLGAQHAVVDLLLLVTQNVETAELLRVQPVLDRDFLEQGMNKYYRISKITKEILEILAWKFSELCSI